MRWLALDIGAERVGVAVCDAGERVTTRLPAIPFRGSSGLAERVAAVVSERETEAVVVGVPCTATGVGRGGRRVEAVVLALRARLSIPVELEDEAGTTRDARERLEAEGVPRRRWDELVDSTAAALILERHLARRGRAQGVPLP
ncbi:MAG: Holliday junction resolvase RuvX [Thermoanaerobaculaceae bacterium]|nr:Holliday junction resolvase RuvX [Thermoanaerobaculaceae bacterium]